MKISLFNVTSLLEKCRFKNWFDFEKHKIGASLVEYCFRQVEQFILGIIGKIMKIIK